MGSLAFGIAASVPKEIVAPLALAVEQAGFSSFWVNDTPGADGLEALRRAASTTGQIRLGVGVIPIDRRPAIDIAHDIRRSGLPEDRLIVGIGAGGIRRESVESVRVAALALRDEVGCSVGIGALGPRMVAVAAEVADAVVLNWLTPPQARLSAKVVRDLTPAGKRCEIVAYVRIALPPAIQQLTAEGSRYASFLQYGRHFKRMGGDPLATCVYGESAQIGIGLNRFIAEVDETVVRAITHEETLSAYLDLVKASAPAA